MDGGKGNVFALLLPVALPPIKTAAPARELLQINSPAQPMGKQSPQAAYNISTCQSAGVSDGLNTLRYTCVAL